MDLEKLKIVNMEIQTALILLLELKNKNELIEMIEQLLHSSNRTLNEIIQSCP